MADQFHVNCLGCILLWLRIHRLLEIKIDDQHMIHTHLYWCLTDMMYLLLSVRADEHQCCIPCVFISFTITMGEIWVNGRVCGQGYIACLPNGSDAYTIHVRGTRLMKMGEFHQLYDVSLEGLKKGMDIVAHLTAFTVSSDLIIFCPRHYESIKKCGRVEECLSC